MYILLLLGGTLLDEIFNSSGKNATRKHRETTFTLGLLNSLGAVIAFGIAASFGARLVFSFESLPTLIPRIIIEIFSAYLVMNAIQKTDRSTFGFYGLLVAPLLILSDVIFGFGITPIQIFGVLGISIVLFSLTHSKSIRNKGSGLLVLIALTNAITITLFKYDVKHYNSIVAEQLIVTSCIMLFFWISYMQVSKKGIGAIFSKPLPFAQTSSKGLGLLLKSYAFSMGPGSVIAVIASSLGLMWSIIFGKAYFHEKHFAHKMLACGFTIIALMMLYWK